MAKIPPPYFSPSLPEIVTCNGFYVTRKGETVEIFHKSEAVPQFFSGKYSDGAYDMWHKSGRMFPATDSDNDIISSLEDKANGETSDRYVKKENRVKELVDSVVRQVAELPDRNSPEDWPEAMIVTGAELEEIILNTLGEYL